ncbi:MAG: ABC transporter permease subunit [Alphaproteobacteria bacterium]|nr:ABC transporter permease subunit [Alphaproteobacteria bacterium]
MLSCVNPDQISGLAWLGCYLSTPKHMAFYQSFLIVLLLIGAVAPLAILLGLLSASASRARFFLVRLPGTLYIAMVRGIPDIVFFLFVPLALDQGIEYLRHRSLCSDQTGSVWQGNDFVVCDIAKMPLSSASQWVHDFYGFSLAVIAFALVFGAFAGNVIAGAMAAVPKAQLETAAAYGMTWRQVYWRIMFRQMWIYALPGLSNIWMILIKATPLLFLLGIQDIVYWARELGGAKTSAFSYPHPDWRIWYFLGLLAFYLMMTWMSERGFAYLNKRFSQGQSMVFNQQKEGA